MVGSFHSVTQTPEIAISIRDRDEFARRGLVRLEQCLPERLVAAARARVLQPLERAGLWRDGAWLVGAADPAAGPIAGHALVEGLKKCGALAALATPELRRAIATLLDVREALPMSPHAQLLFTLPNATAWTVPASLWHLDLPRLPDGGVPAVQMFTFLETVAPGGGGTLVVAGSHRLLNTGQLIRSKDVKKRLKRWPYFCRLMAKDTPDRGRFVHEIGHAEDVELQVVELTGKPGDVYLTDMRLLHTLAPNAARVPRIMVTQRFFPDSTRTALQSALGWEMPAAAAAAS
jgi:hypothetical protein